MQSTIQPQQDQGQIKGKLLKEKEQNTQESDGEAKCAIAINPRILLLYDNYCTNTLEL